MKTKHCKVDLVADSVKDLRVWIEEINESFTNVSHTTIKKIDWEEHNVGVVFDFRCSVFFYSENTKNEIYKTMNLIKSNPITFLN